MSDASFLNAIRARMLSEHARYRWSVASRAAAAVIGGYAAASLFNLAVPLLLAQFGANQAQALLTVTMLSFLLHAAIIMAIFYARSATRAWVWLVGSAVPLGIIVWLLVLGVHV